MDIKSTAVALVKQQLGNTDDNQIGSALDALFGGSDSGDLDLGGLVAKISAGDLAGTVASWLGDGGNVSVSADQVTRALGADQIEAFSSKLGVDKEAAANVLSSILPDLIDKNSNGGSLIGGITGLASKLF